MTEQEMDRVLAEALTVEPSPDFVARVRAQVGTEPTPARWHRWWPAAVAGIAAVALFVGGGPTSDGVAPQAVGGGVVANSERPATGSAQTPQTTRVEPIGPIAVGSRAAEPRVAEGRVVVPRPSPRAFPEVLISPDDAGAVELLLSSARNGISPSAADDSPEHPLMVTQIDVPLLEVAPLAELTQLEPGERQ